MLTPLPIVRHSAVVNQPAHNRGPELTITISREVGAGGRTIAELVAQRLAVAEKKPASTTWAVFDANLAKQVLEDHKLPPHLERFMTEDARLPVEAIVKEVLGLHPSGWTFPGSKPAGG